MYYGRACNLINLPRLIPWIFLEDNARMESLMFAQKGSCWWMLINVCPWTIDYLMVFQSSKSIMLESAIGEIIASISSTRMVYSHILYHITPNGFIWDKSGYLWDSHITMPYEPISRHHPSHELHHSTQRQRTDPPIHHVAALQSPPWWRVGEATVEPMDGGYTKIESGLDWPKMYFDKPQYVSRSGFSG